MSVKKQTETEGHASEPFNCFVSTIQLCSYVVLEIYDRMKTLILAFVACRNAIC